MKNKKKHRINIHDIFSIDNLITLLVSIVIGIVIFCAYFFLRGMKFLDAVDGSFIASGILICVGFLFLIVNQGTFDGIVVGFSNLFSVFKKDGKKKYDGIFEYEQIKAEKRKGTRYRFLAIILSGLIFLIISLILWGIFNSGV